MPLSIYLSTQANPRGAVVISQTNPTPCQLRDMTLGDVRAVNLYIVDGAGAYDGVSGNAGASVMAGIGLAGAVPLWANAGWTPSGSGWAGQLAVPTATFSSLFTGGSNPVELELGIRVTNGAGEPVVFANPLFKLWKSAIDSSVQTSNPFANVGSGSFAIPSGADVGSVTGLNLGIVPRLVLPFVRKPVGGFNLFANVIAGTVTTAGFTFTLSGQTDSTGYFLDYVLLF